MEEIADVAAAAYSQEERKRGEQKSRESTTLSTLFSNYCIKCIQAIL